MLVMPLLITTDFKLDQREKASFFIAPEPLILSAPVSVSNVYLALSPQEPVFVSA